MPSAALPGKPQFHAIRAAGYVPVEVAIKGAIVREPHEIPVDGSPIAAARPSSPPPPADRRELWGYVFWGALGAFILTTETLAAFWSGFPIPTISWTIGQLELHHTWFKLIVVGGLTLVATRITFYPWPFRKLDD
jgi:hypothetical protein